jgi:hypothetical protein
VSPEDITEIRRIAALAGIEGDDLEQNLHRIVYYHPEPLAELQAALQPLHPVDVAILYGGDANRLMWVIRHAGIPKG